MTEQSAWEKRFHRERRARQEAERLLEDRARDLYEANAALAAERSSLEDTVQERTAQLEASNSELRHEIAQRVKVEKSLIAARDEALTLNRQKESFLARVSHEIRTPLNSMVVYARLLNNEQDFDTNKLAAIEKSGEMLLTIVNDLLDVSKVDAGKMDLAHEACDIAHMIDSVLEMVQPEADESQLELATQISRNLPDEVALDGGRLRQILTNLVSNAVKYTQSGSVLVKARLENTEPENVPTSFDRESDVCILELSVSDTGQGIPADRLATLFDPFVRVEDSASPVMGTGLGLAIARRLSVLMGGDLQVTSVENQGSTFVARVACQLTTQARQARSTRQSQQDDVGHLKNMGVAKPLRILTVDDNELNRSVLKTMLEYLGYSTDLVGDGLDAISAVQTQPYDVLLLDIRMPHLDGFEVTKRVRASKSEQPYIVAVTADASVDGKQRYTAAGMDDYLSKPINMTELAEILSRVHSKRGTAPTATAAAAGAVAEPGKTETQSDLIDTSEMQARLGPLADNILQRVVPIFLRELPARLDAIDLGMRQKKPADVANVLHNLKGSSFSVGAFKLGELCQHLQLQADDGELPEADDLTRLNELASKSAELLRAAN